MGFRRRAWRRGLLVLAAVALVLPGCTAVRPAPAPVAADVSAMRTDLRTYVRSTIGFDQVRSVIAATSDEILLERYFGGADRSTTMDVQSVTKSVVSLLVGIAIDEGLIGGVDQTLAELLPDDRDAMSPAVARTTLRQLLTMTGGFPADLDAAGPPFLGADDWVRTILRHPARLPGKRFVYSNGSAHLVAAVLAEAVGPSVLDFARTRLLDRLGIESHPAMEGVARPVNLPAYRRAGFAWPRDPQGVSTGWWGLKVRPRDLLKLGRLMLADGLWAGTRLVSTDWLHDATTTQVDAGGLGSGYGYQWWVRRVDGDPAFAALGYGGQVLEVVPDRDLVVVATTEVRLDDPTSHGVPLPVLLTILEDAVVAHVPPAP